MNSASRRKLSPSGIETRKSLQYALDVLFLRGGNYPHRGLKLNPIGNDLRNLLTSRRKLSPSGIETKPRRWRTRRLKPSRRKLSPSGIETSAKARRAHSWTSSRRKLSPSGIETQAKHYQSSHTQALRGGNYPHRGLKHDRCQPGRHRS